MKKRILILAMLIASTFVISFADDAKASRYYCPYMKACTRNYVPPQGTEPQCGDCSCQPLYDPITNRTRYVCGD